MVKIFINLYQTAGKPINGWASSVTIAGGEQNEIAGRFSTIYKTKNLAWDSIRNSVKELDFEKDEIYFNRTIVNSFEEVEQMVANL